MRRFENEVLSFPVKGSKDFEAMHVKLKQWGHEGFEIVSVVHSHNPHDTYTAFLKREFDDDEA